MCVAGVISITLNCDWKEPGDETEESLEASLRGLEFMMGWFAHPIYLTGKYPPVRPSVQVHCFEMEDPLT